MSSKKEDMIIFCPKMIYFYVCSGRNTKNQDLPNSHFCKKNLVSVEFTDKNHGKPTLHSLIAQHVLEMSVKLIFQYERFEKKHCFALMVLNSFLICFYLKCIWNEIFDNNFIVLLESALKDKINAVYRLFNNLSRSKVMTEVLKIKRKNGKKSSKNQ